MNTTDSTISQAEVISWESVRDAIFATSKLSVVTIFFTWVRQFSLQLIQKICALTKEGIASFYIVALKVSNKLFNQHVCTSSFTLLSFFIGSSLVYVTFNCAQCSWSTSSQNVGLSCFMHQIVNSNISTDN